MLPNAVALIRASRSHHLPVMANSEEKLARELQGPGLFSIIFGAGLSLLVGVLLGVAHLVIKPVEKKTEKELAKETAGSASVLYRPVYFTEGSTAGGSGWRTKQQAFTGGQPGEILLNEAELNALIAALAPPPSAPSKPAAPPPAKPASSADKSKPAAPVTKPAEPAEPEFVAATLAPGVVNFRVRGGVLQVAMAGNLSLLDLAPLVQLRGGFAKGADGFVFQPAEFYFGSLPLHKIPGLSSWLLNKMLAAQKGVPDDLKTAWQKLRNITVEGDNLRLTPP